MALSLRTSLLVLVVVLFACFQLGSGIDCYKCNGKNCKPYANGTDPTETCTDAKPICIKIRDANGTVTERGCQTQFYCDYHSDCASCNTEKCNSSNNLLPSFLLIGIVSTMAAKYYF